MSRVSSVTPTRRREESDLLLTVRLKRRHVRAYRESGILPLEAIAALVRALDKRQLELALGGGE